MKIGEKLSIPIATACAFIGLIVTVVSNGKDFENKVNAQDLRLTDVEKTQKEYRDDIQNMKITEARTDENVKWIKKFLEEKINGKRSQ